jgi:hypothetical protein
MFQFFVLALRVRRVAVAVAGACLLVGGLSVIGVSAAAGSAPATLYAAVTATGSGNCSSVANACTLTTALADTAPGDVVALITSGVEGTSSTYYSGGFSIATAGTSASFPVVIEPAPGVTNPILDGGIANPVLTVANNMYLVIDGVTIQRGNSGSLDAGGITNDSGGRLSVTGSTFAGNTSRYEGGAIDNGDDGGTGTLTVTGSTFASNSSSTGGAIDNGENGTGTLTVTGSTFASNSSAGGDGGAIDNGEFGTGTLTVTGSTFTGNTSGGGGFGGNIASDDPDRSGTATVVAAADIFAGDCADLGGMWTDVGYNVGTDTTCQNGGTGDTTLASLASLLGPLANNGGPTQTMLLLPGNPASGLIPNGTGVLCPLAADQTGPPSPPPGAPCNAGALQAHPVISKVKITGTANAPKVTVTGTGFGTVANLGPATPATACGAPAGSGNNYNNTIPVSDTTRNWVAGTGCTFVGLFVTSYTNSKIVFHFGSNLSTFGGMKTGDKVTVTVLGAAKTVTAPV